MCLAIPVKIKKVDEVHKQAEIENGKKVDISIVPEAKKGDFLLVHSKLAVNILDKRDAKEILKLTEKCRHTHS